MYQNHYVIIYKFLLFKFFIVKHLTWENIQNDLTFFTAQPIYETQILLPHHDMSYIQLTNIFNEFLNFIA